MTAPALIILQIMTEGESKILTKRRLKESPGITQENLIKLLNKKKPGKEDHHHHHQVTIVPRVVMREKTKNHPDDLIVMILLILVPVMMTEGKEKEVQEKEAQARRRATDQCRHLDQEDSMNLENIALSNYPHLTLTKLTVKLGWVNFTRTYV